MLGFPMRHALSACINEVSGQASLFADTQFHVCPPGLQSWPSKLLTQRARAGWLIQGLGHNRDCILSNRRWCTDLVGGDPRHRKHIPLYHGANDCLVKLANVVEKLGVCETKATVDTTKNILYSLAQIQTWDTPQVDHARLLMIAITCMSLLSPPRCGCQDGENHRLGLQQLHCNLKPLMPTQLHSLSI